MKFSSLQEYFYKLQTILFLLLLVPLLGFIALVSGQVNSRSDVVQTDEKLIYVGGALCFLSLLMNVVATFAFNRSMKSTSKKVGLSLKLDQYYAATLMRYAIGSASALVLVVGFFLTNHYAFIVMFGVAIVLFFITWPWPSKVCRDLKLKGDEKEMVYYKKHTL